MAILSPVHVSAANLDTARLKRELGREIVLPAGGTRRIPSAGTREGVRAEALRRVDDPPAVGESLSGAVQDIQPKVPAEKRLAMRAALQEANGA